MSTARSVILEQRVSDFQRALESFEAMRARLMTRRQNATDSAMLRIDEMLALNARTLTSLRFALQATTRELRIEQELAARVQSKAPGQASAPRG